MSMWLTTAFINTLEREVLITVLMPDYTPKEPICFDTSLYIAPRGYESDYLVRKTSIEVSSCKQNSSAVVCLPLYVCENATIKNTVIDEIISLLINLYPLKFDYVQGHAAIKQL
jgi:hypothetical protein